MGVCGLVCGCKTFFHLSPWFSNLGSILELSGKQDKISKAGRCFREAVQGGLLWVSAYSLRFFPIQLIFMKAQQVPGDVLGIGQRDEQNCFSS